MNSMGVHVAKFISIPFMLALLVRLAYVCYMMSDLVPQPTRYKYEYYYEVFLLLNPAILIAFVVYIIIMKICGDRTWLPLFFLLHPFFVFGTIYCRHLGYDEQALILFAATMAMTVVILVSWFISIRAMILNCNVRAR